MIKGKVILKLCSKSRECWEILVNGATEAADQKIEYGQMGRRKLVWSAVLNVPESLRTPS